jgi:hypothetical protein
MSSSASPSSLSELIQFVGEFVRDRYAHTGQYTNGAALATAIRRKYPDVSYVSLGVIRLADVVARAQAEGVVTRRTGIKHLEVAPGPAVGGTPRLADVAEQRPSHSSRRYVRPDLWKAVLLFRPEYGHFLDRRTGQIVTVQASAEDPEWAKTREEKPSYVKIDPITADVQKGWMREYVGSAKLDLAAAPIDHERWWTAFPEWLQRQPYNHLRPWLAYRASKVIDYIQGWAAKNALPPELVFAPQVRPEGRTQPGVSPVPPSTALPDSTETAIRNAVLAVVGDMPMHELLELRVPLRYILRHFRPI